MAARRRRRTPPAKHASTQAPEDGTALGHLSDAELLGELARRRLAKQGGAPPDLSAMEEMAEEVARAAGEESFVAALEALGPEDSSPKPCPRCGRQVRVKARNRVREILTLAGRVRLTRNYHHCAACKHGFYPRDAELKLPEAGDVSDALEKRVLDFGLNDPFEAAAERWSIHYPFSISSNLIRRVVDRVAARQEAAHSALALQRAYRPSTEEAQHSLIVAADGSMLLTREEAWKEAKVAVVARGEDVLQDKGRRSVARARYVAEFAQGDFRAALSAALAAEGADDVANIVWLGDGAPENWSMASELCPFAVQVLDLPHAIQNGVACGKALLGEADPGLPQWEARLKQLLDADSPDAAIGELMDCLPHAPEEAHLQALNQLVRYYRANDKRMRYRAFRAAGLPVGSGIVESAHRHVLQRRMKLAGQRWSLKRARRMARLRAGYRTAGPRAFHAAVRLATHAPLPAARAWATLPNAERRVTRRFPLGRGSRLNRAAASI